MEQRVHCTDIPFCYLSKVDYIINNVPCVVHIISILFGSKIYEHTRNKLNIQCVHTTHNKHSTGHNILVIYIVQ